MPNRDRWPSSRLSATTIGEMPVPCRKYGATASMRSRRSRCVTMRAVGCGSSPVSRRKFCSAHAYTRRENARRPARRSRRASRPRHDSDERVRNQHGADLLRLAGAAARRNANERAIALHARCIHARHRPVRSLGILLAAGGASTTVARRPSGTATTGSSPEASVPCCAGPVRASRRRVPHRDAVGCIQGACRQRIRAVLLDAIRA